MKKQVALALAAAFSLSVAGTALAAPANPFVDVPANHWAYDAIKDLQKDGVVTGYGDGTFRGDRTLTRYEMAAMIAKITDVDGKHEALVKKLQAEFATELYNLGVRVDALEKNASSIKFTGDARIRYQVGQGPIPKDPNGIISDRNSKRFQERVRIYATADINEKTKFIGRLKYESNSNNSSSGFSSGSTTSDTRNLYFDRAEFAFKNGDFGISAGRVVPVLGQGLIWGGERADGVLFKYTPGNFTAVAGYLDVATNLDSSAGKAGTGTGSVNAFVAHLGYNFKDRAELTAAYFGGTSNTTSFESISTDGDFVPGGLKLWSLGTTVKLGSDWAFTGEYVKNQDAPETTKDSAYALRVKYGNSNFNKIGSYYVYAEYLNFGDQALIGASQSSFGPGPIDYGSQAYWLLGSNGTRTAGGGLKGWGIGTEYVFAKNVNFLLSYHKLKANNNYGVSGNYRDMYTVATNFKF